MEEEIWKDIPEFSGRYKASNCGRIKSICRVQDRAGKKYPLPEKILKEHVNDKGYHFVGLHKNKKTYPKLVHVLVLSTFIGERPKGMQACHADDIKKHNYLSNLRWDTPKNNAKDRIRNGNQVCGERSNFAKLTEGQVISIRDDFNSKEYTRKQLADKYHTSKTQIQDILKGYAWKHVGGVIIKKQDRTYHKLTEEQVVQIRALRPTQTLKELGIRFNVHLSLVSLICKNKLWAI